MQILPHLMVRLLALIALALASAAPIQAAQSPAFAAIGEHGATAGVPLELHKAVMPAMQTAWRSADSKMGGGGKSPVPVWPASLHAGTDKAGHTCWCKFQADGERQPARQANRARGPPHI